MTTNGTKKQVLVVDDDGRNVRLLESLLRGEGYDARGVESGVAALAAAAEDPPDLVLLDVMMPEMDGFEVARRLKAGERTKHVPIIMVTALDDRDSRLNGLAAGAEDFLNKPVDRAELLVRVKNLLRLKEFNDFLADHNRILETKVAERTAQLSSSYRETILTMTRAAESRDDDTGAHVKRISFYCAEMARRLGMNEQFRDQIYYASPMHDIGKIGIPDSILLKPGGFTPEEWTVMKTHAAIGGRMLEGADSPYLRMGAEIARWHHERWDGSGYPDALKGEAMPLAARIMQICDVYDALRSKRPYKPPFAHAKSVSIISEGDGRTMPGHFDPAVLDAFRGSAAHFAHIWDANAD